MNDKLRDTIWMAIPIGEFNILQKYIKHRSFAM